MFIVNVHGESFSIVDKKRFHEFWKLIDLNHWEDDTYNSFNLFLENDKSCIDFGAWCGVTTLYMAKKSKNVIAFEPVQELYEELLSNIENNNFKNIIPYNKAIWKNDGIAKIGLKKEKDDSTYTLKCGGSECETISTEVFLNQLEEEINFIKMDIEGAEEQVLPLLADYIKNNKITLNLSLHLKFTKNKDYMNIINNCIKHFPYIYRVGKHNDMLICTYSDKKMKHWVNTKL